MEPGKDQKFPRARLAPRKREMLMGISIVTLIAIAVYAGGSDVPTDLAAKGPAAGDTSAASESQFRKELVAAHARAKRPEGQLPLTALERRAGLVKRAGNIDGGRLLLNVTIVPENTCMVGDLNLIEQDLQHAERPNLLLTIERLAGPESEPIQFHQLAPEHLVTGANVRMAVPLTDGTQQVGLFLCLDSSGTRRCQNKPPMDFERQVREYGMADADRSAAAANPAALAALDKRYAKLSGDKIYYFSFLSLSAEAVLALPPQIDTVQYSAFGEYAQSAGPDAGAHIQVVEAVKRLNGSLSSVPLDISSERLQLKLPRFSSEACSQKTKPAATSAPTAVESPDRR